MILFLKLPQCFDIKTNYNYQLPYIILMTFGCEIGTAWAPAFYWIQFKTNNKKHSTSVSFEHVASLCSILLLPFPTLHSQLRFEVLFRILNDCYVSHLKIVISMSVLLWFEIKNYLALRSPTLHCISVRSSGYSLKFKSVVYWFNSQHKRGSTLLFLIAL